MFKCLVFCCLALAVSAKLIEFTPCELSDEQKDKCTVSEVSIEPCTSKTVCSIKKKTDTHLSFKFTPHFSASRLQNEVVYMKQKWDQIPDDACTSTACPVVADTTYSYNYTLFLHKRLPDGIFSFDWRVKDEANPDNVCCLGITIKIRK